MAGVSDLAANAGSAAARTPREEGCPTPRPSNNARSAGASRVGPVVEGQAISGARITLPKCIGKTMAKPAME